MQHHHHPPCIVAGRVNISCWLMDSRIQTHLLYQVRWCHPVFIWSQKQLWINPRLQGYTFDPESLVLILNLFHCDFRIIGFLFKHWNHYVIVQASKYSKHRKWNLRTLCFQTALSPFHSNIPFLGTLPWLKPSFMEEWKVREEKGCSSVSIAGRAAGLCPFQNWNECNWNQNKKEFTQMF